MVSNSLPLIHDTTRKSKIFGDTEKIRRSEEYSDTSVFREHGKTCRHFSGENNAFYIRIFDVIL